MTDRTSHDWDAPSQDDATDEANEARDDYDAYDDEYDPWEDDDPWDGGDDDEYVAMPRQSSRGRRILLVLGTLLVMTLVAVVAGGLWVQRQIDPPGAPGDVKEIVIPEGATSDDIGVLLADEGIISSSFVWEWYLRVNGGGPFQAGLYQLPTDSSMSDVVDVLSQGPRPPEERSFTLPEGLTVPEAVARLADPDEGLGLDAAVLQGILDRGEVRSAFQPADQPSNEGILFPETYRAPADIDEAGVLQMLVGELDATLNELDVTSAQDRLGLSPYEILIVASLIEEETKVDAERPMVARVIYNRLADSIPLGIDATSRYEAELLGRSRDDVDFESDSPYNTRRQAGLPPTPIASPGRASLEAALNPADGPWLYYVLTDAAGNHLFTESYSEFLQAKDACEAAGLGCG